MFRFLNRYVGDLMPILLPQASHNDEGRRKETVVVMRSLASPSSNLDTLSSMFLTMKNVLELITMEGFILLGQASEILQLERCNNLSFKGLLATFVSQVEGMPRKHNHYLLGKIEVDLKKVINYNSIETKL
eukprot:c13596_g1_i1 orf=237-629(+)